MTPQHGVDPKTTPMPYVLQISKSQLKAGEATQVTITGKLVVLSIRLKHWLQIKARSLSFVEAVLHVNEINTYPRQDMSL